jgi:O-Antigen ligase
MEVDDRADGKSVPETIAWLVFCLTCVQLVFQTPSIIVVPWQRANVFSGLLCAITLLCAVTLTKKKSSWAKSSEILISAILLALAVLSSLLSDVPKSACTRAFVIMASGLGGFWSARLLINTPSRHKQFQWLCSVLLAGLITVSLIGYFVTGVFEHFITKSPHAVVGALFLLSFGPLALLFRSSRTISFLAFGLLGAGGVVIYYSGLRAAYLIPPLLLSIACAMKAIRLRYLLVFLVIMAALAPITWHRIPEVKFTKDNETFYYRVENYPFSLHVALKNPVLGIGPRAPRERFLDDYGILYPYVTKEQYRASLNRIVTSENIFLTLLVDMGFPFVLIYGVSVLVLILRLFSQCKAPRPPILHPLALLYPVIAALVYFQLFDGLYYPQLCWFFHILLALIPRPAVTVNGDQ